MSLDPNLTVAVVLAGGRGTRLHELTDRECKPALPFARHHRIVDCTMANLVRSGVDQVVVATQYSPATLSAHLRGVWGTTLPTGGLVLRHGPAIAPGSGYAGTADVLRANSALLDDMGAKRVLVVAADHVYAMDYAPFIAAHDASGAALTLAAMPVPRAEASRFGVVTEGPGGRVARFAEKPRTPAAMPSDPESALASLGIYVIDWPWLREILADPTMQDFGDDVIPRAVSIGEASVWRWSGYWRDVGTLDGLRESWLEFDQPSPPCPRPLVPGMALQTVSIGKVRDRFQSQVDLGGVRLMLPTIGSEDPHRWAALDRSILMPGARVGPGVRLTNVIVGPGTVIPDGMRIGDDLDEDARWFRLSGETVLVTPSMLARRAALRSPLFPLFPRTQPSLRNKTVASR